MSGSAKSSQSFHFGRLWTLAFFGIIAYGASIYIAASFGYQGFINWNLDLARKIAQIPTIFGVGEGWYAKLPQVIDLGKVDFSNDILLPRGEVDVITTSGGDFATLTRVVATIVLPVLIGLLIIQAFRFGSYMLNQDTADHSGYYPGQPMSTLPFIFGGSMNNTPTASHEAETNKYDWYIRLTKYVVGPISLALFASAAWVYIIVPINNRFSDNKMDPGSNNLIDRLFSGIGQVIFTIVSLVERVVGLGIFVVGASVIALIVLILFAAPFRNATEASAGLYRALPGLWWQRSIMVGVIMIPILIVIMYIISVVAGAFSSIF